MLVSQFAIFCEIPPLSDPTTSESLEFQGNVEFLEEESTDDESDEDDEDATCFANGIVWSNDLAISLTLKTCPGIFLICRKRDQRKAFFHS